MPKFETLVIYDEDGPIDVIYGKHSELLRTLKKHELWDEIAEELSAIKVDPKAVANIEDLICWIIHPDYDSIKIKLFTEQSYKP